MDWLKSVCAPFSSNQSVWETVREGHGSEGPWHDDDHWWACRPGSCCEARASTRTTRPKQTPAHTHNRWRPEGLCCGRKDARASSIPSLAGVGIVFRARDGHLLVAEVTADGPAQQSGKVVPGQKLLMMSGTRVAGLDRFALATDWEQFLHLPRLLNVSVLTAHLRRTAGTDCHDPPTAFAGSCQPP